MKYIFDLIACLKTLYSCVWNMSDYLTEFKNILANLNPYKAILFGSYADVPDSLNYSVKGTDMNETIAQY